MSICEDCILFGRCSGVCGEVDGGINEYFSQLNDDYEYAETQGDIYENRKEI